MDSKTRIRAREKHHCTYFVYTALDEFGEQRRDDLEQPRNERQILHSGHDVGYLVKDFEYFVLEVGLVKPTLGASVTKRRDGVESEAARGIPEGDPAPSTRGSAQLLDPALCVGVDHVLHAEDIPPRQGVRDEALLGRVDGTV